nr:hypothetical protein [Tanacetum cinerariifolium]
MSHRSHIDIKPEILMSGQRIFRIHYRFLGEHRVFLQPDSELNEADAWYYACLHAGIGVLHNVSKTREELSALIAHGRRCSNGSERYAETLSDFFAAAVRAELVAENDGTITEHAEFKLEVDQQQAGIVEQLGQDFVDFEGQLFHANQLLGGAPTERHDVGIIDERIALGVVLQKQFERVRVQLHALLHAQALDQAAGGVVTNDALDRDHVELFDQHFVVGQQFVELGRNASSFELLHDEGVELVVHHAFAVELFDSLAVERRGVVAEHKDQAVSVIGLVNRLGFAAVEFFTFFHDGLRLLNDVGESPVWDVRRFHASRARNPDRPIVASLRRSQGCRRSIAGPDAAGCSCCSDGPAPGVASPATQAHSPGWRPDGCSDGPGPRLHAA